jgi:hypothetical protein
MKTSVESEPITPQAGPAPMARRETTLPALPLLPCPPVPTPRFANE